jgi:hypothetical protein
MALVSKVVHGVAGVMVREVVLPVRLRLMISIACPPVGIVRFGDNGPIVETAVADIKLDVGTGVAWSTPV